MSDAHDKLTETYVWGDHEGSPAFDALHEMAVIVEALKVMRRAYEEKNVEEFAGTFSDIVGAAKIGMLACGHMGGMLQTIENLPDDAAASTWKKFDAVHQQWLKENGL